MFCLAPVLLAGYLFTLQPNQAHVSHVDATVYEVQTCEKGLGMHIRAQAAGLYGLGLHYGVQYRFNEDWRVTFQPRAGLSYTDQYRYELPAEHQFELGLQLTVGYKHARIGVDYWHLSNAGLKSPNIGLDMIGVVAGWSF